MQIFFSASLQSNYTIWILGYQFWFVLASDQFQTEIEIVNVQVLISIWEVHTNSLLNIILPEKKMLFVYIAVNVAVWLRYQFPWFNFWLCLIDSNSRIEVGWWLGGRLLEPGSLDFSSRQRLCIDQALPLCHSKFFCLQVCLLARINMHQVLWNWFQRMI
jgi:hypothetical protein